MKRDSGATDLWRLLRAIATDDRTSASRMLASSPELASESLHRGATRTSPADYFITEIARQVYAGDTALHIAAAAFHADIAKQLIALGADIGAANRMGTRPLHYAAVGQPASQRWNPTAQARVITLLLQSGADANVADKSGVAPLHRAVRTRSAEAVRALLDNGADARRRNGGGSTPLHLAVQNTGRSGSGSTDAREQQRQIIRLLLQHGARRDDTDGRGKTVAESASRREIADLLDA